MSNTTPLIHPQLLPRVLVVDGDESARDLYREYLRGGWMVDEACDGREALAKVLSEPPALVITETQLPYIDGYALCELMRKDFATRHVPILVVTTDSRPSQIARAQAAGASAVMAKPVDPDRILESLQRLTEAVAERDTRAAATQQSIVAQRQMPDGSPPITRQRMQSRTCERRMTTTPPLEPPGAVCPDCDRRLSYQNSQIGGVTNRESEQWDYYRCPGRCGSYQYRHRTRKLRRI
jgi:two-component system, chemotaxis family, chemotaxis protein CheY